MSHSKDYGLDIVRTTNAFSPSSVKQLASAIIWEETSALKIIIKECEAQLLALRRSFAFWKSHQNRLSDVFKLPEDVLINIWLYCAENSGENLGSLKEWLAITHVCSHWRKLAVGAQGLWRWPCVLHPTLAISLLNRAGNTPLTLLVDFDQISDMNSEEAALESFTLAGRLLHRTESLTLKTTGSIFSPSSRSFFSSLKEGGFKVIENLKSLSIDSGYYSPTLRAHQQLDLTGLIHSVPGLRAIWLRNMTILASPSQMTPLPQITLLEIIINSANPDSLPGWSQIQQSPLHKVLSSIMMLPNLRHLVLVEVFEPLTAEDHEWLKANPYSIALSSLQVLWLASNIETIQHFLNHVAYPQATEVTIETTLEGPQLDALASLLATSTDIERMCGPIRSLHLSRETSDDSGIDTNYIGFSTRPTCINPTVDFLLSQDKSDPFPNLPHICSFDHLEQITCELPTGTFNTELWKAFGSLPKLRRVSGSGVGNDPAFMKVLASFRPSGESIFYPCTAQVGEDSVADNEESTTPRLYFPNLTNIPTAVSISTREDLRRVMIVRNTWNVHCGF